MILRKANLTELPLIWSIIQQAIEQRKQDGSKQWQNGYPNELVIEQDIANSQAFVLIENQKIIAYSALIFGIEPAYTEIEGDWLTDDDYAIVHRVAVADSAKGKGIATLLFKMIENLCIKNKVYSIKVDTNYDNVPMLKILENLNYTYCGIVQFTGGSRKAYEKVLHKLN